MINFPIISRPVTKLLSSELVEIKPLSAPSGKFYYTDFTLKGTGKFYPINQKNNGKINLKNFMIKKSKVIMDTGYVYSPYIPIMKISVDFTIKPLKNIRTKEYIKLKKDFEKFYDEYTSK
ncbi:MAG: hypothetical protein ABIP51_15195 [Bacteroidia bacterium]